MLAEPERSLESPESISRSLSKAQRPTCKLFSIMSSVVKVTRC